MASYTASIDLEVRADKALSQIGKVEKAINRLSGIGSAGKEFKEALVPDTKQLGRLGKELDVIKNRANSTAKVFARLFEGIGTAGVTAAGLEAINAKMFELAASTGNAAASIQALDKNTGDLSRFIPGFTVLKDSVNASAVEVNKLQYGLQQFLNNTEGIREFVQNFYTMDGAAGAATAGLLALAGVLEGQLRQNLGDIEQAGSKAFKGLQEDIANNTSELNRLINATRGTADQYRNLIRLGEERRDSYNSSSREARQAINTIVRAEEKLTDELRAQADLKRAAKGVTVTELEAAKGRKSIDTKQKAEAFNTQQLQEQERVYEAIARLNGRSGTALQEKLNIQRNITNLATLEAQRAQEAQFKGQSMRIPTPYRTAGSLGFPVALPEIAQDRKLRAQEQSREAAKTALEQQKANSLLVQGVTSLKIQVAVAEQLNGVYDEIVRTLKVANDRQSQLFRATQNRQKRQGLGEENLQRLERINKLETNRVLQEELKNKVALAGNAIRKNEFTTAKQIGEEIDMLIKAEDQRIDRARRVVAFRKKERADRASRRKEALGSGIIGGAFPLLFGQGPGASVGGGLGGFLGGLVGGQFGFGLALVGTTVGQLFDELTIKAAAIGTALKGATSNMEGLREAGISVTAELEAQVRALNRAGESAKAQELVTREVANQTGDFGGVGGTAIAASVNELKKAWDGVVSSVATLIGLIASPFVYAITAALRLVQLLAVGVNAITTAVGNLILIIPGAKQLGDLLYEQSVKGTEEYEKRQVALDKEIESLYSAVQLQKGYNKGLEKASALRGEEYKFAVRLLDYRKQAAESDKAIAAKQEELGQGSTGEERQRIGKLLFEFRKAEYQKLKQTRLQIERDVLVNQENNIKRINAMNEKNARTFRDMRLSIERQIEDERIKAARAVEDIEIKKAKAVLDFRQKELNIIQEQRRGELEVNAALRQLQASVSANPQREGLAASLTTAVEKYKNGLAEASEKRALTEEKIRIDTVEASVRLERFKQDNARRIARINEDSERKIADINEKIAKQRVESSKFAYEYILKGLIARTKKDLKDTQASIGFNKALLENPYLSEQGRAEQKAFISALEAEKREREKTITFLDGILKKLPKTPVLTDLGALPQLTDLSSQVSKEETALNAYLTKAREALAIREEDNDKAKESKKLALEAINSIKQQVGALEGITASNNNQIEQARKYLSLLKEGVNPELAKQFSTIDATRDNVIKDIDTVITELDKLKDSALYGVIQDLTNLGNADVPQAAERQKQQAETLAALQTEVEQREKIANYVQQMNKDLNDLAGLSIQAAQTIETSLATAFSDLVTSLTDETKTAQQAFENLFRSISTAFLDMATKMIAKALILKALGILFPGSGFKFSGGSAGAGLSAANLMGGSGFGFPRFANGGNPPVNKPSIVGERGPELFVPGRSGTVVPNHKLGGDNISVVVNVDAKGTSVQGNDQQGNQLGRVISATIQQELIKQKRPGGLLA